MNCRLVLLLKFMEIYFDVRTEKLTNTGNKHFKNQLVDKIFLKAIPGRKTSAKVLLLNCTKNMKTNVDLAFHIFL